MLASRGIGHCWLLHTRACIELAGSCFSFPTACHLHRAFCTMHGWSFWSLATGGRVICRVHAPKRCRWVACNGVRHLQQTCFCVGERHLSVCVGVRRFNVHEDACASGAGCGGIRWVEPLPRPPCTVPSRCSVWYHRFCCSCGTWCVYCLSLFPCQSDQAAWSRLSLCAFVFRCRIVCVVFLQMPCRLC